MKNLRIKFQYEDNGVVQAEASRTFEDFGKDKVSSVMGDMASDRLEFLVRMFAQYAEGNITPRSIPENIDLRKI